MAGSCAITQIARWVHDGMSVLVASLRHHILMFGFMAFWRCIEAALVSHCAWPTMNDIWPPIDAVSLFS
eukprot:1692006-Karenia_brevis.AAC.1